MDISGFYCKVCKVQMNSQYMWDSHINGKKHIKKANKDMDVAESVDNPPDGTSTPAEEEEDPGYVDKEARIMDTLKDVADPIVGLDYIVELQYPDSDIHPSYSCTLCKCTIGVMAVVEHIKSTKHRMNYVEHNDTDGFLILDKMQSSGVPLDGLAEVRAISLEQKIGRGNVKVKLEKSKFGSLSGMRKRPQTNMGDDFSQKRSNSSYSRYHAVELSPSERQFVAQIPYFDTKTKLKMLEQLSSVDITNDDEAKEAMNMITSLTNLLCRFKSALADQEVNMSRQTYNEPVGYPSPMSSRGSYGTPSFRPSGYGPRPSFM